MGSCDYVGLFMNFNIYKINETNEITGDIEITYVANEITGDYQYFSSYFDELILKVVKHEYKNDSFYTEYLNIFIKELKKRE